MILKARREHVQLQISSNCTGHSCTFDLYDQKDEGHGDVSPRKVNGNANCRGSESLRYHNL